jgi:glycosyltransferase involved in cell wall biosynthesis
MKAPFFSIVVSVYNRPNEIMRCIHSCLSQSFSDFELIVVDDASTDDTFQVLARVEDPRLKLIRHSTNRGQGAARNSGNDAAQGIWLIRLDSDHALLPGALEILWLKCRELPGNIAVLGARYLWESGMLTPRFMPENDLDYVGRIRWAEEEGGYDYLSCTRREVFQRVRWEECMHPNALFQLDQARLFYVRILPDVLAVEYAPEFSILRSPTWPRWELRRRSAPAQAAYFVRMLECHGNALRAFGPHQYHHTCMQAAFYLFLVGQRSRGIHYAWKSLRLAPLSLTGWALLATGLLGYDVMQIGYGMRDWLGSMMKEHPI